MMNERAMVREENKERAAMGDPPLPPLHELRRIAKDRGVKVYRQGGDWIRVTRGADGCGHEQNLGPGCFQATERLALAKALGV